MRSGYIDIDKGYLGNIGINGYCYSKTAASRQSNGVANPSASRLELHIDYVNPSHGPNGRWGGFPLLCLVRGGGSHTNASLE